MLDFRYGHYLSLAEIVVIRASKAVVLRNYRRQPAAGVRSLSAGFLLGRSNPGDMDRIDWAVGLVNQLKVPITETIIGLYQGVHKPSNTPPVLITPQNPGENVCQGLNL